MKLGVLFSGGKDSCYALFKAGKEHEIVCLITMASDNPDSYMFHTPNIEMTKLQSEALDIPLISGRTKGEKEEELS
jgi:diphthine-ammonia ligase